jgi:hypothetical protein
MRIIGLISLLAQTFIDFSAFSNAFWQKEEGGSVV